MLMPAGKMHADEVDTDMSLVRRLLAAQFPRWADLPLRPVPSGGTDNAIYRLGDDMAVRLPRIAWAIGQVAKEQQWLPRLAPQAQGQKRVLVGPCPLAQGMHGAETMPEGKTQNAAKPGGEQHGRGKGTRCGRAHFSAANRLLAVIAVEL